jgi:hypothetical protein
MSDIVGFIPFYYNREMMDMSQYPDIYFGAYDRYCKGMLD